MAVQTEIAHQIVRVEEEDHRKKLLLDPRPPEEMNRDILRAMTSTGLGYWLTVGVLATLVLIGL